SCADFEPFGRGEDPFAHRKLGAHPRTMEDVSGYGFAVWAPRASSVSLLGEFNDWNERRHRMRCLGDSGIWEIFIPGLAPSSQYKYRVFSQDGFTDKADPFAAYCEGAPGNASLTCDLSGHAWGDAEWVERRAKINQRDMAFSAYEAHLGSWRQKPDGSPLSYLELADELPRYLKKLGFTHLEFLPLAEYPLGASWGYQVSGYFAPTSRFGSPGDFMHLIDALHREEIGVVMDWVPAHFPRDDFALANFDGGPTYEYEDSRLSEHQDWGTLIFDYARPEVRSFLMSSALAWLDRYHVDGLRVDAVASMIYLDYSREEGQWLPNRHGGRENLEAISLLRQTNDEVHRRYPGVITIAEESTAFPKVTGAVDQGGLGFDFKWNMGWMHDVLEYFSASSTERSGLSEKLTYGGTYQYSEHFVQVFSHDEVVHGKSPMIFKMGADGGDVSTHAAHLRSLYAYMWAWPGKKTLFMGNEFGQTEEWNSDVSLNWNLLEFSDHAGLSQLVGDLNELYRTHSFLGAGDPVADKFRWIECGQREESVFAFFRFGDSLEHTLLAAFNFSGDPLHGHRLGVPTAGSWRVALHTMDKVYGGSIDSQLPSLPADDVPAGDWEFSIALDLPASCGVLLMPAGE
ncbi:MAG: 1,4-alpha-glucan branching protein GlgB, partial [Opitutales bacterium]